MNGKQQPGTRGRRSQAEVEGLVAEYEASGLGQQAFCNQHGLSLSTLNRHRKRQQMASEPAKASRWVAVELSDREQAPAHSAVGRPLLSLAQFGNDLVYVVFPAARHAFYVIASTAFSGGCIDSLKNCDLSDTRIRR